MITSVQNDARVDFPLSSQAKTMIETAAMLTGQTLTDFAVSTLLEKARMIVQTERVRILSEQEARAFLTLLDSDSPPNECFRRRHVATRRTMTVPWRIERFSSGHDRSGFSCGIPALDDFLQRLVSQYEKRDYARVYVAVLPESPVVLGYYTLSTSLLEVTCLPAESSKRLPSFPAPVALLGRLAVTQSFQKRGLGKTY